tara:strand:+ start:226 stop:384 length:159 start_codon:yes stop_codon:yes gene_type:complete
MFEIGDLVENTETKLYPPGIVLQASTDVAEVVVLHFNGDKIIWSHTMLRVLK